MFEDYTTVIWYSRQDGCYVAAIQELEGCMAHGSTPEEALREIRVACDIWIQSALEDGAALPLMAAHPLFA